MTLLGLGATSCSIGKPPENGVKSRVWAAWSANWTACSCEMAGCLRGDLGISLPIGRSYLEASPGEQDEKRCKKWHTLFLVVHVLLLHVLNVSLA